MHIDADLFRQDLSHASWNTLDFSQDINTVLNKWSKLFLAVVNKQAPLKTKWVKHAKQPPWMTPNVINLRIERNAEKKHVLRRINTYN